MPTFVALLRGVNVGKAKRVPMADLRALLSELGYTRVTTLLNSGNAVFRAAKGTPARHAADIAGAIAARLQVEVPVVVKSATEFSAIVVGNTLAEQARDHSRLLVAFVQDSNALANLAVIGRLIVPPEQFLVGKGAAYLHCANGILESKAGAALLGKVGQLTTTRNWATVLKLQALVAGQAGENKTQPTDASIEGYIDARVADEQQRADCRDLMALLKRVTRQPPGMWGPSIVGYGTYEYTYGSGRTGRAPLASFAIRGRDLVVYLSCEGQEQRSLLTKVGKHRMGKSCLYFRRLADLDPRVLEGLVVDSIAEVRRRHG